MPNRPFRTLFSNPSFVKLWLSQALSQLTIQLVNFSILTRVFEVTRSTVAVSLLWVAYSLPALFFAPFSGSVVDRFSRRRMMLVTNFLQAVTVAMYLWVPRHLWLLLYVLVFAYSFLDQLYLPSQQASIPTLVEKKLLLAANGIFLLTQQASFLVGFGLGGVFLTLLGRDPTTILASLFLVAAAVAVFLLPKDRAMATRTRLNWTVYLADFKRGYDFIRSRREVMYPLLLIAFTQIFMTVIAVVLPTYTHQVLGLNLNLASVTFVVPGAAGALLLTYLLPKLMMGRRKKSVIELGMVVASVALLVLALISQTGVWKVPLAILIAICLGIAIAAVVVPAQTLLQEKTPTWFRGRVYSSLNFLLIIVTSVPLFISAIVADIFGVAAMIGGAAVVMLLSLLFVKWEGDYVLSHGLGL